MDGVLLVQNQLFMAVISQDRLLSSVIGSVHFVIGPLHLLLGYGSPTPSSLAEVMSPQGHSELFYLGDSYNMMHEFILNGVSRHVSFCEFVTHFPSTTLTHLLPILANLPSLRNADSLFP